ncbi:MAG: hypothetical protein MUF45_00100 [Spirosomaceae bacterium]|jgi:hypothetical protein|nr:hypothetical protein [Spirosomataceae bacterium]
MTLQEVSIYDEISEFIAQMNPKKVIGFKPSENSQKRVDTLFEKQKANMLSAEEKNELEHYLIINRIIGLAKARAIKMTAK